MGDVTVLHQVPSTITLYKLDGEKFTTLGSNLGCAVVGSAVSLTYQLLCYGEGVPSTVTATISPTNTIQYSTAQGQLYASFTADDGITYSIAFRNDSDAVNLSVHLGLAFYGSKARPPDTVTTYDLITGSGKSVDQNDTVGVVATGWIVSNNEKNLPVTGTVYQQLGTLDNLFKTKIGDGTVSTGLAQGIRGMKKESKRVLVIPGAFQGGAGGQTLVYIVHVVKVKWDTSPAQPPKPPVPNGVSAADFADFEEFKRMKAAQLAQQGATQALAAPPGSMPPTQPQQPYGSPYGQPQQPVQPVQPNIYQQPQVQPNPYQQPSPYQQPQIVPPQPQVVVQPQPVVQTVNVPVLTAVEIGAVQAALSEHASQHQTSLQQLQMHFQQQHINLSSSVDTIIARLSSTSTKIENLEGHRLFKENQGSMSGVAITASISKLVNDNDTFRAEVNEKDEKIVELKKKVEELRKKAESYATESAGILEEKKSAVNQVAETKAELEREIARLKETLQRAYNERDDAQRHLHTVKKLHDLSEEELRRTKQRLDGLDTSSQADSERINDLQQTIREEKTKNKEVSQKANALRDELAEEKEAHLRTQQQLDERRKKNEAERTHYTELIEQERRTAAEELRRVREEMKESSGVKERHWEEEKALLTETVAERARIEGMKQGRDEANAVSSVTIANMQTQLDNAATEITGLQERISSLQALIEAKGREFAQFQEQTQEEKAALNAEREAALEEARAIKAEAERVREEADKEIKETLEASQQRVKSIMSTVYFKFSKSMREHRKSKNGRHGIRREEAIERLLAIIKAQTLRGLEATAEESDEEEDDDEDEGYRSNSPVPYSPAPPSQTAAPAPITPRELLEKTVATPRDTESVAKFVPNVTPEPTVVAAAPAAEEETPVTLPHPATTTFDESDEEEEEVSTPLQPREVIITSTHVGPELDDTDTEEQVTEAPIPVKEEEEEEEETSAQDPLTVTEEEPAEATTPAAIPAVTPATEAEEEEPVSAPVVVESPAPPKKKSYFDSDSEDEKESEPMSDPVVVEPLAEPVAEERSDTPQPPAPEKAPTPEPEVEAEPVVVEQPVEQEAPEPPRAPSPAPAATKKGLFDSDDEDEPPRKAASEPAAAAAAAASPAKKKGLFDSDDEEEDDGIMSAIGAKKEESKGKMFDSDDEDPFS